MSNKRRFAFIPLACFLMVMTIYVLTSNTLADVAAYPAPGGPGVAAGTAGYPPPRPGARPPASPVAANGPVSEPPVAFAPTSFIYMPAFRLDRRAAGQGVSYTGSALRRDYPQFPHLQISCDDVQQYAGWSFVYAMASKCPQNPNVEDVGFLTPGPGPGGALDVPAWEAAIATLGPYRLVYNECNLAGSLSCGGSGPYEPEKVADDYMDRVRPLIQQVDPNGRFILGGATADKCGIAWMTRFADHLQARWQAQGGVPGSWPPEVAGWQFNMWPLINYDWRTGGPCTERSDTTQNDWRNQMADMAAFKRTYGGEIWIKEWALHSSTANQAAYMHAVLSYVYSRQGAWLTRWAWFTNYDDFGRHWWDLWQVNPDNGGSLYLSTAGRVYRAYYRR